MYVCCNKLQHSTTQLAIHFNTLEHTATLCNTLHYTGTHHNTLHRTAPYCYTLHHTATHICAHCNYKSRINGKLHSHSVLMHELMTPQHITRDCNTLQHIATNVYQRPRAHIPHHVHFHGHTCSRTN